MICNLNKRKKIIRKTEHIENIEKNESGKTKKSRQGRQKEPKEKITGKRRETKKKQKRRTKKRKKLCSTSPPGGNQVDGLPPVPHTATVAIHNRLGPRKSVLFAHSFDCVVAVLLMIQKFLLETHPLAY